MVPVSDPLVAWFRDHDVRVLEVAGPCASQQLGIEVLTAGFRQLLLALVVFNSGHPRGTSWQPGSQQ